MKHTQFLLPLAMVMTALTSCEKNNDPVADTGYSKGVYIVNEGTFNANNGSISYFNPVTNEITNGIFEYANQRSAGDVVQSFSVVNDSIGYIVVNNSAKIEIVSLKTFRAKTAPVAITYPRYFLQVTANKGYLTAGSFEGYVFTFDLNSHTKTDSIQVGFGPETLLLLNGMVYVANSGGWGADSTISVINPETDDVIDTIYVGQIPVDMAVDGDENLWVYCKGYTNYADIETEAFIQKIDPVSGQILWQAEVGMALDYSSTPAKCAVSKDGSVFYYLRPDGVYRVNSEIPVLNNSPFIAGNFYGIDVNPDDDQIYLFESSFTGNGKMKIYESNSGTLVKEGVVGIGPNGAVFNL